MQDSLQRTQTQYASDLANLAAQQKSVVADLSSKLQAQLKKADEDMAARDTLYKRDLKSLEENQAVYVRDTNAQSA